MPLRMYLYLVTNKPSTMKFKRKSFNIRCIERFIAQSTMRAAWLKCSERNCSSLFAFCQHTLQSRIDVPPPPTIYFIKRCIPGHSYRNSPLPLNNFEPRGRCPNQTLNCPAKVTPVVCLLC